MIRLRPCGIHSVSLPRGGRHSLAQSRVTVRGRHCMPVPGPSGGGHGGRRTRSAQCLTIFRINPQHLKRRDNESIRQRLREKVTIRQGAVSATSLRSHRSERLQFAVAGLQRQNRMHRKITITQHRTTSNLSEEAEAWTGRCYFQRLLSFVY